VICRRDRALAIKSFFIASAILHSNISNKTSDLAGTIREESPSSRHELEAQWMTRKHYIVGFAAATVVPMFLAGAFLTAANRETKPVQIAQSGQKAKPGSVYCYNGLKVDPLDKWAPLYRGWVCIPTRVN
jgi:hypothetical protein